MDLHFWKKVAASWVISEQLLVQIPLLVNVLVGVFLVYIMLLRILSSRGPINSYEIE